MSFNFMPAEEDDGFDLEDGFMDYDYYSENVDFKVNGASSESSKTQRVVFPKPSNYELEKENERSHGIFSSPSHQQKSSPFVTTEDLRMAIMKNNKEVAEKYIDLGLHVDESLRSGWTALMYAADYARPAFVTLLLKNGANANYQCDMHTPLMCACSANSGNEQEVEECVKILISAGVDVNARDRLHRTPLMLASREGYLSTVKVLLAAGAKVNMQDSCGWTALTMATQRCRAAIVVELLDSGADPDIQHCDKLTVKNLAAHLASDEMLALLERRPVNSSKQPLHQIQGASPTSNGLTSNHCILGSGDSQARLTDLRYGELELFLLGLDLGHLVGVFRQQLIDLQLLLTLTEQDLINAGVEQVGARKKILDAVQAVHKKDWKPSSLVSIHYNKRISCADAVAMLANSSRHLRYICSTVIYVKQQLKKHPDTIMLPTDRVSPNQFYRHAEDTMKNVRILASQVEKLKNNLEKEMSRHNVDPPDLITSTRKPKSSQILSSRRVGGALVLLACLSAVAWWGKDWSLRHIATALG